MAPRRAVTLSFLLLAVVLLFASAEARVDNGYASKCFFSLAQSSSGVWWFIDPNGNPFYSAGASVVTYNGNTSKNKTNPYNDAVKAKFGSNQTAWAESAVDRLASWNMNTIGPWSSDSVATMGMPWTKILNLGTGYSASFANGLFPDVFDPAWEESARKIAASVCTPLRNDPTLLGYFTDNELYWGPIGGGGETRVPGTMLDQFLISLNSTAHGNQRAVSFLQTRYASIDDLNAAWNSSYGSFETIKSIPPTTSAHTNDSNDFTYIVSRQYFNITRTVIKMYDPHHLLLGAKFMSVPSKPVLRGNADFHDVISINYYPSSAERSGPPTSKMAVWYTQIEQKAPFMITEFCYRGKDSGLPNTKGGGIVVPTQADRGSGYHNFTTLQAKSPAVVGLLWFQWFDQPAAGRAGDGEDSNMGLVSNNDTTWTGLTDQVTTTIPTLPDIHESAPSGLPSAMCLSELTCPNNCSGNGCCNNQTGLCTCYPGFSSLDCSTDNSQITINSFGDALDTTVWKAYTATWASQVFAASRVSVTEEGWLELAIAPCSSGSPCGSSPTGGSNSFSVGSVLSQSTGFGYGFYSALLRVPSTSGFNVYFELHSSTSQDLINFRIASNDSRALLAYKHAGVSGTSKWADLPFSTSDGGFHNYSIHYTPDFFGLYADGELLALHNNNETTTTGVGLPNTTMALFFYIGTTSSAPAVDDAVYVKSVYYHVEGTNDCPGSGDDGGGGGGGGGDDNHSAASRQLSAVSRLLGLVSSILGMYL